MRKFMSSAVYNGNFKVARVYTLLVHAAGAVVNCCLKEQSSNYKERDFEISSLWLSRCYVLFLFSECV